MNHVPKEILAVGLGIAVLNVGLGVWFGGLFAVVNFLSAALVGASVGWSLLGAPGADRLGRVLFES